MGLIHPIGETRIRIYFPMTHRHRIPCPASASVALLDVAPTILELAGAPIPASFEGRGLLSLLAGGAVEEGSERKIHSISTRNPGEAALVQGRWKLIRSGSGTLELFDLLEDRRSGAAGLGRSPPSKGATRGSCGR